MFEPLLAAIMLWVVGDRSCTIDRGPLGPFLFANLFQFSNILGMSGVNPSLEVMPEGLLEA